MGSTYKAKSEQDQTQRRLTPLKYCSSSMELVSDLFEGPHGVVVDNVIYTTKEQNNYKIPLIQLIYNTLLSN